MYNRNGSPKRLSAAFGRGPAQSVSVGPDMQKLFEKGELNRGDFENELKKAGVNLID